LMGPGGDRGEGTGRVTPGGSGRAGYRRRRARSQVETGDSSRDRRPLSTSVERERAVEADGAGVHVVAVAVDTHADVLEAGPCAHSRHLQGGLRSGRDGEAPAHGGRIEPEQPEAASRELLVGLTPTGEGVVLRLPVDGVGGNGERAVEEAVGLVLPVALLEDLEPGHDGEPDEDDGDDEEEELLLSHGGVGDGGEVGTGRGRCDSYLAVPLFRSGRQKASTLPKAAP